MKKIIIAVAFLALLIRESSGQNKSIVNIIPEPVTINLLKGYFMLPAQVIISTNHIDASFSASLLKEGLATATGKNINVANTGAPATISLVINSSHDKNIGLEGYYLNVTPKNIIIKANTGAGIFYGVQSLLQLFPKEIEGKSINRNIVWQLPIVEITDYPRFGWRGLMFDVARHFFSIKEVKQYIDAMVKYKYNLLHLHLSDDEGWRIEIKKYPKLTQVGAWRVDKTGYFGNFSPPTPEEPKSYGGFYTQEDIKDLVKYAKQRHVDLMPEIDVPGHSLAAVASYPELSCTPGADKYQPRSGEKIMDWHNDGTFEALIDNNLCPANEKVYEFLDNVFTEVAALFPFTYIHVGGDECAKNFWEKSPAVKELMQKEKLKNMEEVQGYFERRMEKILKSKGKKMMGWDEILEGGISPETAAMSWRGLKGGIEGAKAGHQIVMAPGNFAYLDLVQGDIAIEPRVYNSLSLTTSYKFEPLPDSVDQKFIMGGQANLWTEQITNMRHAEYMTWPRAFAIAESVWSPKGKKNWPRFIEKIEQHFKRFDEAVIKYAPTMYDPSFAVGTNENGQLVVTVTTELSGLDTYYTFDNSFPDNFYPKYSQPLMVPKDASLMRVITYRNGKQIGRMVTTSIEDLKKRVKKNKL